jgi:hypothetical protein
MRLMLWAKATSISGVAWLSDIGASRRPARREGPLSAGIGGTS